MKFWRATLRQRASAFRLICDVGRSASAWLCCDSRRIAIGFLQDSATQKGKRANLFHEVSRHHFGEKQLGWTHALTENILMLDYERR